MFSNQFQYLHLVSSTEQNCSGQSSDKMESKEDGCPKKCGLIRGERDAAILKVHLFEDHHRKSWAAKVNPVAVAVGPGAWEVKCERCVVLCLAG